MCLGRLGAQAKEVAPNLIELLDDPKGEVRAAAATALGEMGARLVLTARKADELEAACAQLRTDGIDASWIAADTAREADIGALVDGILQRLGHVDILVNNAGATWGAAMEDSR